MSGGAYYNECDHEKAAVLRELIRHDVIAPGEVDERSITDVRADELRGFTQCHFFAGFGVWSYALRLAGWPDDEPCWTGSCPCPSFSCAGKGAGFDDPRHLWPRWFRLIREYRPTVTFGEQVDSAIGHGWLDLVGMDLEGEAYSVAAAVLPAASVGAPHKRNRLYFVAERADAEHAIGRPEHEKHGEAHGRDGLGRSGATGDGPDPADTRRDDAGCSRALRVLRTWRRMQPELAARGGARPGEAARGRPCGEPSGHGDAGNPDDTLGARLEGHLGDVGEWRGPGWLDPQQTRRVAATGATRGVWANCDWWYGRDGKYRPIGRGISPLIGSNAQKCGRQGESIRANGEPQDGATQAGIASGGGSAQSCLLALADGTATSMGLVRHPSGTDVEGLEEIEPETGEARVMRLRGYGDAIVAQVAAAFIAAYREARSGTLDGGNES